MLAETRLWADVYNASWERIGDGPIPLTSASVTRAFDGAGSISFEAPATDERVIALLKNERRIKIVYNDPQTGVVRTLGSGIIRKRGRKYTAGGFQKTFSGPDVLDELKRYNTLLGRIYTNTAVGDVASSLAVLAGWQAETETALDNLITARFDGASILKALQTMTEQIGVHIREKVDIPSDRDHIIEVGHFGTDSGLYIMNPEMVTARVFENDDVAFIDSLTIVDESSEMFNWVIAIGSGEGESALSLEHATRSATYARETTVVGDKTLYFKKNDASIAEYGVIQKVITFKDIAPVGNSATAIGYAADMLDEATDNALDRNGAPQTVYRLSIKKGSKLIRAGDVIHLNFRGAIRDKDGQEIGDETVEGDFYVIRVTENVSASGVTLSLEISNIDKLPESEAAYVLSAIEDIKLRNVKPALTNFRQSEGGEREMQQWDGTPNYITTALFELPIDETVTDVTLVLLRFSSLPMRSRNAYLGGTFLNTFMIADSNENPQDISLYINDTNVTSVFGPSGSFWNPYPANSTVDNELLDITDYILNASGGLHQTHTIEFRLSERTRPVEIPGYGSLNAVYGNMGLIRATITLMGTSQAIKSS
jgi:hypothetical protein